MKAWPKKIIARSIVWLFWKVLGDGWGLYTKEGSNIRHLPDSDMESFSNRISVDKEDFDTGRAKPTK